MSENNERVEPRNVTMYPHQWASVDQFAKGMGYPSTSAALRRVVDEWAQFKGAQMGLELDLAASPSPAGR